MATIFFLLLASPLLSLPLDGYTSVSLEGAQHMALTREPGLSIHIDAPADFELTRATDLILYALPNGNSTEQTRGRALAEGDHWRFDIQHTGAQIRLLRTLRPDRNIVLVHLENRQKSWPTWRRETPESSARILLLVDEIRALVPGDENVTLTGHSGGGSMTFGFLNGVDEVPPWVDRIALLDSNYAFDAAQGHGRKIAAWLRGDARRQLVVLAYDDRFIELDGKRVVSETGGTLRATERMRAALAEEIPLSTTTVGPWRRISGPGVEMRIHPNAEKAILHTTMVGEYEGFAWALAVGTPLEAELPLTTGGRRYAPWITAKP